ncbi:MULTISPECIES: hypothetical protein [Metabacillus]|uniref:Uncharacterized protein n=2 Tax=Metabacillus TaxID=2675233 RepID=A0A179T1J2_9BACI|nr:MULTISPECIES: hypothetical protein [Metabacillus]OAS86949.1 hypothetical protein A6K24_21045 [Metabacillus litoralis]QNF27824.1 hypothetical protein HUW50_10100 [Metabacillus sp. KUDC1714]
MYQNFYPHTPVYGYTGNLYNNYPNMQWPNNEYRLTNFTQHVGKLMAAPADVEGYFPKGTRIFIHRTYFDNEGQQMVIVVYPFQNPNTGMSSVRSRTFSALQLDGIQPI